MLAFLEKLAGALGAGSNSSTLPVLTAVGAVSLVTAAVVFQRSRSGQAERERMARTHVVIVGAGVSGICAAVQLKLKGIPFTVIEQEKGLGGTWRKNTYPGCACDVPSLLYSYSFEQNPDWSKSHGGQEEILEYLKYVANKHGIVEHIRFSTEVVSALWSVEDRTWVVTVKSGGETSELSAAFFVSAVGQLDRPIVPALEGIDDFKGSSFHSAKWDASADLRGKTVTCIGTGASAIQIIPKIADKCKHLNVLQRSAPWVIPGGKSEHSSLTKCLYRYVPGLQRLARYIMYLNLEKNWAFLIRSSNSFVAKKFQNWATTMQNSAIPSKDLQKLVTPDYNIGCKRILIADDYYTTLARDNVTVISGGAVKVEEDGVVVKGADERLETVKSDVIIYASGFASHNFCGGMDIRGVGGASLPEVFSKRPEAYLGMTVPDFPNFFMLYGPNTNLGHHSIIFIVECQVNYILSSITWVLGKGKDMMSLRGSVLDEYYVELRPRLGRSAWGGNCTSWYKTKDGASQIVNNWPGTVTEYWWRLRQDKLPANYDLA